MFLSLLDPTAARELTAVGDRLWQAAVDRWRDGGRVVVFDEAVRVIGVAICGWAGLPLTSHNARRRVWDLEQIVDGFGGIGPRHVAARLARRRSERWVAGLVRDVRAGRHQAPPGSALEVVANHRQLDGKLLDDHRRAIRTCVLEPIRVGSPDTPVIGWRRRGYPPAYGDLRPAGYPAVGARWCRRTTDSVG